MRHATATLVVNESEASIARKVAPGAAVHVVSNGVDLDTLKRPAGPDDKPRVVFCGMMNYAPNEDGILWFVREVWPGVRARRPDATLTIVGAHPTRRLRRVCEPDGSIEVTGTVPDVRPYLWNATVSVAPLRVARGLQNKVLEAAAAGLPSVVTPTVFEGLPMEAKPACLVASDADVFGESTVRLLDASAAERRGMLARADLQSLSWRTCLAPLRELLEAARASRSHETTSGQLRQRCG
jgi:glycosyltransferase involved in cell wall biosynthesis